MKLLLMADRRESLSVMEENGRLTGIFICPDIYAGYLSRKIVQEIQPVDRSCGGAWKGLLLSPGAIRWYPIRLSRLFWTV